MNCDKGYGYCNELCRDMGACVHSDAPAIVALMPPCPCGANIHLIDRPEVLRRKNVLVRRAIGCGVHAEGRWRPAAWESVALFPFAFCGRR